MVDPRVEKIEALKSRIETARTVLDNDDPTLAEAVAFLFKACGPAQAPEASDCISGIPRSSAIHELQAFPSNVMRSVKAAFTFDSRITQRIAALDAAIGIRQLGLRPASHPEVAPRIPVAASTGSSWIGVVPLADPRREKIETLKTRIAKAKTLLDNDDPAISEGVAFLYKCCAPAQAPEASDCVGPPRSSLLHELQAFPTNVMRSLKSAATFDSHLAARIAALDAAINLMERRIARRCAVGNDPALAQLPAVCAWLGRVPLDPRREKIETLEARIAKAKTLLNNDDPAISEGVAFLYKWCAPAQVPDASDCVGPPRSSLLHELQAFPTNVMRSMKSIVTFDSHLTQRIASLDAAISLVESRVARETDAAPKLASSCTWLGVRSGSGKLPQEVQEEVKPTPALVPKVDLRLNCMPASDISPAGLGAVPFNPELLAEAMMSSANSCMAQEAEMRRGGMTSPRLVVLA